MANKYFKAFNFFKDKVSPTIKSVKPTFPTTKLGKGMRDLNKSVLETKGKMKKRNQDFEAAIRKVETKIGQTSQKIRNEPVTKSGFSKGKDKKIIEKKANGGRIGRRFGSPNPKKTNVQKIKETFGPKKKNLSPKQMKIAKLAGNPNKIDGADFKKLRNK